MAVLTVAILLGGSPLAQEPGCLEPREPECVDPTVSGWFTDEASQLACLEELDRYTAQLRDYVNCTSADAQARIGEAYKRYNCKLRRDATCP
jgi:hypothetical protein